MQQIRSIVRTVILEMASKRNLKLFSIARQMDDPDVQRYIAFLDSATSERELSHKASPGDFIADIRQRGDTYDGASLHHILFAMKNEREDEIRREQKVRERAAIDARKAERQQKKDAISSKIQHGLSNPVLKAALDKIGDGFHAKLKARHVENDTDIISRYFTDGIFNLIDPDPDYKQWIRDPKGRAEKDQYESIRSNLLPFIYKKNPYSSEVSNLLNPDWKKLVDARGQRYADDIVNSWKNKMSLKLGEVIDRKGGADISLQGELWNEYMKFIFSDHSTFDMKTQQVYARSKLGKAFVRFPTTFHNVRFSDGMTMVNPSSDKMQAEFGISEKTATIGK